MTTASERPPIERVLIANRGEVARRVIHTCRELGIYTVAVHSEVDRRAPFVQEADQAVPLAGDSATETYLDADQVLAAARQTRAQAVHPGYGFLSENAEFARAVRRAGLIWVGPPPEAMAQLGSKARARALAEREGIPVVPGVGEDARDDAKLLERARELGFPLLIKASAGGGGKGMRVVERAEDFPLALEAARREAQAAFGDDQLLLERLLKNPRHLEVQVFGDAHGQVVHLGERECSLQRRHQKVCEEGPAPALDGSLRRRLAQAAVRLARAAGYVNAGTVEFMLDDAGNYYFLEVNTRLQVEHPVTEWTTGFDLVAWQLDVAAGQELPVSQGAIVPRGHAVEVRLYAEDPARGFAPQTGRVECLHLPQGPGLRWDSGVEVGCEVGPHYDPLLAKLIVWGPERASALRRLRAALAQTVVLGVNTNLTFLQDLTAHPAFCQGRTHTGFLQEHFPAWRQPDPAPVDWLALAAFELWGQGGRSAPAPQENVAAPWTAADGWRNL